MFVGEVVITPGFPPSAAGTCDGFTGPVTAVIALIALDLAPDGRAVPAELIIYIGKGKPLQMKCRNHIPFFRGDLAVTHRCIPLLGG